MLSGRVFHSTAWVEWHNIRRLNALNVPTMRPVIFAESMLGLWERASLLCTEQVMGESLERWIPANWAKAVETFGFCWRKQTVTQLADLVARLHAGCLCHRDLYTSHIFIDVAKDGKVRFCLIDLQRMIRPWLRRRRWWVKDLAALAASARTMAAPTGAAPIWRRRRSAPEISRVRTACGSC